TLKERLAEIHAEQKWLIQCESARAINAAIDLMRSEPGIPILPEEFDRDPWLFNCPNGTLDLRTGKLREHRREDYITKLCPTEYQADATCPAWDRFLASTLIEEQGKTDPDLIEFMQRFLGYSLTGDTSEDVFPIFYGAGSNGKTTLLGTGLDVMG